ncbi:MAG: hypothetical protein A2Y95_03845 [Deltaproteobacteria bacterium RBG_13_65_10]|nr:MAG: hypothetical protein A2Y95_03845 [Deltaproteobacteria bacterium RBG_13_65_10]
MAYRGHPLASMVAVFVALLLAGCQHVPSFRRAPARPPLGVPCVFVATAYAHTGLTASGVPTRRGLVAADPKVLPIGTRIFVRDAGPYSGEYLVADTGSAIDGYEIDLWMESREEALRFGRCAVLVEVLRYGEP